MLKKTAQVSSEAIAQEVSGETVILDLKSEQYFSLDTVGTRVWQLLQASSHIEEIYQQLLEEYDVEPSRLRTDLEDLLTALEKEGLISLAEEVD